MESNIFNNYRDWLDAQKMPKGKRSALLAGLELFAQNGYDGTSTAQIAEKAGISQATIFKYFKTKQDLLMDILTPIIQNFIPMYRDDFFDNFEKHSGNLETLIHFVVNDRYKFLKENTDSVLILFSELLINPDIRKLFSKLVFDSRPVFTKKVIKALQSTHQVREDFTPMETIRTIIGQLLPYFLQQHFLPETIKNEDEDLESIEKIIINTLHK
ncbi:TetR family transcriptional regulator [Companilactobacillus tucceti DSM 20183]|uniref:TetR family transcriptional regulator n=1 Tax=Companilactobacillus tucceti DSM 20183 TaxID=1423811 RepID=A0A0R1IX80_9LACO|nr:TetR/AcrR family transcriptional regulator [Companilactobacillus tucceti]KRK63686.1 TetR family transcriptional regulator [Companilactobacillus tucceti DSM 20183]